MKNGAIFIVLDTEKVEKPKRWRPVPEIILATLVAVPLSLLVNFFSNIKQFTCMYEGALFAIIVSFISSLYYFWKRGDAQGRVLKRIEGLEKVTPSDLLEIEDKIFGDAKLKKRMRLAALIACVFVAIGCLLFAYNNMKSYQKESKTNYNIQEAQSNDLKTINETLKEIKTQIQQFTLRFDTLQNELLAKDSQKTRSQSNSLKRKN